LHGANVVTVLQLRAQRNLIGKGAAIRQLHRMIAEQYIRDGRWDLIETPSPSAGGRKSSKRARGK